MAIVGPVREHHLCCGLCASGFLEGLPIAKSKPSRTHVVTLASVLGPLVIWDFRHVTQVSQLGSLFCSLGVPAEIIQSG